MRTDSDIRKDIQAELQWTPEIDETDLAVKVQCGEVTLSGFADNYLTKYEAEIVTRRIKGVTAVANDIAVRPLRSRPADQEVRRAVAECHRE